MALIHGNSRPPGHTTCIHGCASSHHNTKVPCCWLELLMIAVIQLDSRDQIFLGISNNPLPCKRLPTPAHSQVLSRLPEQPPPTPGLSGTCCTYNRLRTRPTGNQVDTRVFQDYCCPARIACYFGLNYIIRHITPRRLCFRHSSPRFTAVMIRNTSSSRDIHLG